MGVPGLTSFIDDNLHILADQKLHDCKLVIDGNNLYHHIYTHFKVSHQYGGDYDTFNKCIRLFFRCLQQCNIQPYVVLDGARDPSDRKLKTCLKRAENRLHLAGLLSHGGRPKVLPILCHETFQSVLDDLHIPNVTCTYEADEEIAALAEAWGCPVLSNDSDFFIFGCRGGFILLDYLDLAVCTGTDDGKEIHYLNAQIYHKTSLLQIIKPADESVLPLFATLKGNDYVKASKFEPFFSSVKLPKSTDRSVMSCRRQETIARLLMWLQDQKDATNAIRKILSHFKKDQRADIELLISTSINSYRIGKSQLLDHFENGTFMPNDLVTYSGHSVPDWFSHGAHAGAQSVFVLDVLALHRVILLCQVEQMECPSSYLCSAQLRKALFSLLFTVDRPPGLDSILRKKPRLFHVEVWDRDQKNLRKQEVKPDYQLPDGAELPALSAIPDVSPADRVELIHKICDIQPEVFAEVNYHMQLSLLAVLYWANHAQPGVSLLHVSSLLICILKLVMIEPANQKSVEAASEVEQSQAVNQSEHPTQKTHSQATEASHTQTTGLGNAATSQQVAAQALEKLQPFTKAQQHSQRHPIEPEVIHAFTQYQTCLQAVVALNRVLLCPLPDVTADRVFNGTFLYNMYKELVRRKDPQLYVSELLGRSTSLNQTYQRLFELISDHVKEVNLSQAQRKVSKKSKSKKGKRTSKDKKSSTHRTSSASCGAGGDIKRPKVVTVANCELSNRFGGLTFEDYVSDQDETSDNSAHD